jgi:hypothetical protein
MINDDYIAHIEKLNTLYEQKVAQLNASYEQKIAQKKERLQIDYNQRCVQNELETSELKAQILMPLIEKQKKIDNLEKNLQEEYSTNLVLRETNNNLIIRNNMLSQIIKEMNSQNERKDLEIADCKKKIAELEDRADKQDFYFVDN